MFNGLLRTKPYSYIFSVNDIWPRDIYFRFTKVRWLFVIWVIHNMKAARSDPNAIRNCLLDVYVYI